MSKFTICTIHDNTMIWLYSNFTVVFISVVVASQWTDVIMISMATADFHQTTGKRSPMRYMFRKTCSLYINFSSSCWTPNSRVNAWDLVWCIKLVTLPIFSMHLWSEAGLSHVPMHKSESPSLLYLLPWQSTYRRSLLSSYNDSK